MYYLGFFLIERNCLGIWILLFRKKILKLEKRFKDCFLISWKYDVEYGSVWVVMGIINCFKNRLSWLDLFFVFRLRLSLVFKIYWNLISYFV